jgi:hypothetical protein
MFPAQRTFGREDIFEQAPSTGTLIPEAHHTGLNYVPCNLLAFQEAASDAENTHTHTHTHTHTPAPVRSYPKPRTPHPQLSDTSDPLPLHPLPGHGCHLCTAPSIQREPPHKK